MQKSSVFFIFFFFVLPSPLSAAFIISEIMYDVPGTDSGREWIEIANTEGSPRDVSGFKFFEANTNHGLVLYSGSGVVASGEAAVIADDAEKFLIDWPSYTGVLLESSFSLSNAGELLLLRDSSLLDLDSVSYDVSIGGAGDGNTLTRQGSAFVAAAATPGVHASVTEQTQNQTALPQTSSQTTPQATASAPDALTVHLEAEATSLVGAGSFFEATAYGVKGEPLVSNVRYLWNFGDGATAEGKRVFHVFHYTGKYSVQVTAAYNYSSGSARSEVQAVAGAVSFEAQNDGSALIKNQTGQHVEIGLWSLRAGEKVFVIPEGTRVMQNEGVRFAPAVLGFSVDTATELFYPNGSVAFTAGLSINSPLRGERVPLSATSVSAPRAFSPAAGSAFIGEEEPQESLTASVASAPLLDFPFWSSVAGLVALLTVGSVGVWYLQGLSRSVTLRPEDEFEIE